MRRIIFDGRSHGRQTPFCFEESLIIVCPNCGCMFESDELMGDIDINHPENGYYACPWCYKRVQIKIMEEEP